VRAMGNLGRVWWWKFERSRKKSFYALKVRRDIERDFAGRMFLPYPICQITGRYRRTV